MPLAAYLEIRGETLVGCCALSTVVETIDGGRRPPDSCHSWPDTRSRQMPSAATKEKRVDLSNDVNRAPADAAIAYTASVQRRKTETRSTEIPGGTFANCRVSERARSTTRARTRDLRINCPSSLHGDRRVDEEWHGLICQGPRSDSGADPISNPHCRSDRVGSWLSMPINRLPKSPNLTRARQ
jgi:hypothetical protein